MNQYFYRAYVKFKYGSSRVLNSLISFATTSASS